MRQATPAHLSVETHMTRAESAVHVESGRSFDDAVRARRAVRAFRPDPVPQALLEHVFSLAGRAPSNCNTQPWLSVMFSGAACERLRQVFTTGFASGRISMDFPYAEKYQGVYRERQHDAACQLYAAMGIERDDREARARAFMRNFGFYDAPHVVFVFIPDWAGIREAADAGMYTQTLMLGMAAHGIASCPQTALSFLCDEVRAEAGIDASWKLLLGISCGYEDAGVPANACRLGRAPLADSVRFID